MAKKKISSTEIYLTKLQDHRITLQNIPKNENIYYLIREYNPSRRKFISQFKLHKKYKDYVKYAN